MNRGKGLAPLLALVAGFGLFAASAAAGQGGQGGDLANRVISAPNPDGFRVDGVSGRAQVRADPAVQFGRALRVPVPGRSEQPWSVSVAVPINRAVAAGDGLLLAFWARLEEGENGATTAELPYNAVQLAVAPYTALFRGPATITREWHLYQVRGRTDRAYAAGELNVALHLATGRQTIDIGPVFVLNMGQATP